MKALARFRSAPPGASISKSAVRFAFMVLLAINTLNYVDRYILPAVLPKIQAEFHLSPLQEGLLGSAFLIVYALSTLPLGVLADRGLRKNIVGICVGLWSLATLVAGVTRNFSQLFTARALLGIGEGGYAPASVSLLGDYFPQFKRGRVLAYWTAGSIFGAAIGFVAGGMIADTLGWRVAFYVAGIPGMIVALLAFWMVEPQRGIQEAGLIHGPIASVGRSTRPIAVATFTKVAKELVTIRTYWVVLAAYIFSLFAVGAVTYWLPTYCVTAFHLSLKSAGLLSGIVLVTSGVAGTLGGGWLSDLAAAHWASGRLGVVTLGFLAGTPFVLWALLMQNLAGFIALIIIAALFLNFCNAPLNALLQDVIEPRMLATAVGIVLLLGHLLGDAFAPLAIGALDGTVHSLWLALVATVPLTFLLAGLVCLVGMKTVGADVRALQPESPGP